MIEIPLIFAIMDGSSEYSQYLNMPSVPAGVILSRIIKKQSMMQVEVARLAGLAPQRLYDLIQGNRKFNPKISASLEKAL